MTGGQRHRRRSHPAAKTLVLLAAARLILTQSKGFTRGKTKGGDSGRVRCPHCGRGYPALSRFRTRYCDDCKIATEPVDR